ncbi:NlpC/P60 family protein [Streptomyces sp. NPDC050738]|uniref:C40 family peptidase n=1 Tax=Streptomyces sp. NPDC050738 TaxID=3154744 RepID=UPI00342F682F
MASHRRPKPANRTRVTVLTATAAAAVALSSQAAHADPKPTKSEVKAKVDKLYEEAEKATNQYNGAKEKQDKLKTQVDDLQDTVARGQADLNKVRDQLGALASAQYRSGGIDESVQLFLSSDPGNFLDKASSMDQLSAQQAEALKTFQSKQRSLAQQRQEAQDKLQDLADTRKQLGENKKAAQEKLADAQKLLNSLTAQERAALQQEDAERANRDSSRLDLGNQKAASGVAQAALDAARTRIGKPYVRSGTGPNSFDCSGLTSWAYRQAGVEITRTTYTQINRGTQISRSELKPGDLVFFNSTEHVGLYAGGGVVLHAPKPGAYVRLESMSTIGTYQTAVRI